jgi:uncharacterized protein YkwD
MIASKKVLKNSLFFLVCTGMLSCTSSPHAMAGPLPRWPEPAWFQLGTTPVSLPEASQETSNPGEPPSPPTPINEQAGSSPANQPAPSVTPEPAQTTGSYGWGPRWPQPAWFLQGAQPAPPVQPPTNQEEVSFPVNQPPPEESMLTSAENELYRLLNQERNNRGLSPVIVDPTVTQVARLKSQDMIKHNYLGHVSPTYGQLGDMLRQAGVSYYMAGENLARAGNVTAAHSMMMDSSIHRAAIINPRYTHVGIGILPATTGLVITEIFLVPGI